MTAALALAEAAHIHDEVAADLGMDPDRLRAELADAIATPLPWAEVTE